MSFLSFFFVIYINTRGIFWTNTVIKSIILVLLWNCIWSKAFYISGFSSLHHLLQLSANIKWSLKYRSIYRHFHAYIFPTLLISFMSLSNVSSAKTVLETYCIHRSKIIIVIWPLISIQYNKMLDNLFKKLSLIVHLNPHFFVFSLRINVP